MTIYEPSSGCSHIQCGVFCSPFTDGGAAFDSDLTVAVEDDEGAGGGADDDEESEGRSRLTPMVLF